MCLVLNAALTYYWAFFWPKGTGGMVIAVFVGLIVFGLNATALLRIRMDLPNVRHRALLTALNFSFLVPGVAWLAKAPG